ncbi:hypothetical protein DL93DRAFT_2173352 [Clavulina sp. PMI_390]|nr:hypothetical protein DL93DRAFT_2173352 [Clavulina sp. PMI_390]
MDATHSFDITFAGALQLLLNQPGKLEDVLRAKSADGSASRTHERLSVVIERALNVAPDLVHDVLRRVEERAVTDRDDDEVLIADGLLDRNSYQDEEAYEEYEDNEEDEEDRPAKKSKAVTEIDLAEAISLINGPGMSWKNACSANIFQLQSRMAPGGGHLLSQSIAVQKAIRLVLEGFDADIVNHLNWRMMFPQHQDCAQEFKDSLKRILEIHGLADNVVLNDYSALSTTPALALSDTMENFMRRLAIYVLLLDLVVDYLNEPVPHPTKRRTRTAENEICNQNLHNLLLTRHTWTPGSKWSLRVEIRAATSLLNNYVKWGPIILLVRIFQFRVYRTSTYKAVASHTTHLWANIMKDPEVAEQLAVKKRTAGKILLQFVYSFGGLDTLYAFRGILERLDGFGLKWKRTILATV